MAEEIWSGTYESVPLNTQETSSQLVDGRAIDAFAHAIQSFNPVHMDGEWARANTHYPDRIAHGVMTTALMSQPIVQFCERWKIRTALGIYFVKIHRSGGRRRHCYNHYSFG